MFKLQVHFNAIKKIISYDFYPKESADFLKVCKKNQKEIGQKVTFNHKPVLTDFQSCPQSSPQMENIFHP